MAANPTAEHDRTLDVREIDGEPFGPITDALDDLEAGESLLLLNSFEPVPLYDVLDRRGFEYSAERTDGVWRIEIERV